MQHLISIQYQMNLINQRTLFKVDIKLMAQFASIEILMNLTVLFLLLLPLHHPFMHLHLPQIGMMKDTNSDLHSLIKTTHL